jgi:Mg2+ and Co2+ transporter CorA
MNIRAMPELDHPHAYLILIGVTLALMIGTGVWLKSKRWF